MIIYEDPGISHQTEGEEVESSQNWSQGPERNQMCRAGAISLPGPHLTADGLRGRKSDSSWTLKETDQPWFQIQWKDLLWSNFGQRIKSDANKAPCLWVGGGTEAVFMEGVVAVDLTDLPGHKEQTDLLLLEKCQYLLAKHRPLPFSQNAL